MTNNAYDKITERILEMMEQGVCPWKQPWSTKIAPPQNICTGHHYKGMNYFMLCQSGCKSPYFMTFKQVQELGGNIKKGSHGFPVIYWGTTEVNTKEEPEESDERPNDGKNKLKIIPFLRSYTVFNEEQIEGIRFPPRPKPEASHFCPIERAEEILKSWRDAPKTLHGYANAYYKPETDTIHLPNKQDFENPEEYYSTRFHEMGHATGATHRLNRDFVHRYGSQAYSREELVAEMTSAFLCAECGIDNHVIHNQAAYMIGWAKAIRDDSRLIVVAAGQAQRAANYIQGIEREAPIPGRAEHLARSMEVRRLAHEIAESRRTKDAQKDMGIEISM